MSLATLITAIIGLSKNNKNALQNRGGNRSRVTALVNPPRIVSNIVTNHTYRFLSTTNNPKAFTASTLLGAIGGICTVTNTAVSSFASSVKVNSVTIWSPPASQGNSVTCSCEWVGNQFCPDKEISDSTMSVATPAHLHSRPPPMSTASFWQTVNGTPLATLIAPIGSIIDVNLSFVLADGQGTQYTSSIVTGALGVVYYLSLDGPASNLYTAVSMTTTH